MALSIAQIVQCREDGADTNGGGFNPMNANFLTDLTATSATGNSPVVSSVSYTFVAGDVGAWLHIKAGTNWLTGWYQIASVAGGNATLSAAIGAALRSTNVFDGTYNLRDFSLNTTAGCASVASPTGGTFSIDYSMQAAAEVSVTDGVTAGSTTVESENANFTKAMTGNLIYIAGGTGSVTPAWYEITSVTDENTIIVDRSTGLTAGTGVTLKIGGAMRSPKVAHDSVMVGKDVLFIKEGSYLLQTAAIQPKTGDYAVHTTFWGYRNIPTDLDQSTDYLHHPVVGNNNATTFVFNNDVDNLSYFITLRNLVIDGGAGASKATRGIYCDQYNWIVNCKITRCTAYGLYCGNGNTIIDRVFVTKLESGATYGIHNDTGAAIYSSWVHNNPCPGIWHGSGGGPLQDSIISFNTGDGVIGNHGGEPSGSVFYGNAGEGLQVDDDAANAAWVVRNNIFAKNTGAGFHGARSTIPYRIHFHDYNAYYGNGSTVAHTPHGPHDKILTVNPFVGPFSAVNAAWTAATKTLTKTGAFTDAYVGGQVHVESGTGVTRGRYTIATVLSADAVTLTTSCAASDQTDLEILPIFELNDLAGGGAELRAARSSCIIPPSLAVGYADIGPYQHREGVLVGSRLRW